MLIFEHSKKGRRSLTPLGLPKERKSDIPADLLRQQAIGLPEVPELDLVRHYTRASQENYAVDTHFYPLGSCTMKYNPKIAHEVASLGWLDLHPLLVEQEGQGLLQTLCELQDMLAVITGMQAIALSPMAGAQGELAGIKIIRAFHKADPERNEILIPDSAHGTNPASAAMGGFVVREVPTKKDGDIDLLALQGMLGPKTAGMMFTNPSTLGLFERHILAVSKAVHDAGGLMYYDGANLNALLGLVKPSDMGFDIVHLNLHKTFATPHGTGGPGAGPIGVTAKLAAFLPGPIVIQNGGSYGWRKPSSSIGRLGAFYGNIGVLLRAWAYLRLLGKNGLPRVSFYATLAANYLRQRLKKEGFDIAYPERMASHELIVSAKKIKDETGVSALDIAKRLLDKGCYAPTIYFPQLVPECLLIEPTETENKDTLDAFVTAMVEIRHEAYTNPKLVREAPWKTPVRRLDEVQAARNLDLVWNQ
jgi:glycine dehydrogenase subunit 2